MTEREGKEPDIASLTFHDQKMARESHSEWSLTARSPIALADLTGGKIPLRADLEEGIETYRRLVHMPLSVFSAEKEGEQEFLAVGPRLTAEDVNALFYIAAPCKSFGFDTQDIIADWTDLYTEPEHAKRKKAHASMPGWSQFEESREVLLDFLDFNYDEDTEQFDQVNYDDAIVPVLRWKQDAEKGPQIILKSIDEELRQSLSQVLPYQISDANRFDNGMGIMLLAAYSPKQTLWPSEDTYKHPDSEATQVIGPAQVLAYAYREIARAQSDASQVEPHTDLQQSPLLAGLSEYLTTGVLPIVPVSVHRQGESLELPNSGEAVLFSASTEE